MKHLRILLIEDNANDRFLVESFLSLDKAIDFQITCAGRFSEALEHLKKNTFDLAISDLALPDNQGLATFEALHEKAPAMPIIVLSGDDNSETARKAIQGGAQDFLPKHELTPLLLIRTILYAIDRNQIERERLDLIGQLQEALREVKTLSGLLPICACCKKIRDDQGHWSQIDAYLARHTDATFSHCFCPGCAIKNLEDFGLEVPTHLRELAKKTT